MTPPTAILGGFTVALLIGAAGNVISHSERVRAIGSLNESEVSRVNAHAVGVTFPTRGYKETGASNEVNTSSDLTRPALETSRAGFISLSSNAAAPNGAAACLAGAVAGDSPAPCEGTANAGAHDIHSESCKTGGPDRLSSPSAPVGAAGVSAQSSNGQENRRRSETEAIGRRASAAEVATRLPADARFEPSPALLDSIRFCESAGSDVSTPNHAGALGPYQLLEPTWNDHAAGVPWSRAVDEPTARVVAARYLAWIDRTLTKWQGRPATVEQVLVSWNGGIGRLRSVGFDVDKMPAESREFVRRVNKRMEVDRD